MTACETVGVFYDKAPFEHLCSEAHTADVKDLRLDQPSGAGKTLLNRIK